MLRLNKKLALPLKQQSKRENWSFENYVNRMPVELPPEIQTSRPKPRLSYQGFALPVRNPCSFIHSPARVGH